MSESDDRSRALEEARGRRDAALALAQLTMSREAVMAFGRAGLALRRLERRGASAPEDPDMLPAP